MRRMMTRYHLAQNQSSLEAKVARACRLLTNRVVMQSTRKRSTTCSSCSSVAFLTGDWQIPKQGNRLGDTVSDHDCFPVHCLSASLASRRGPDRERGGSSRKKQKEKQKGAAAVTHPHSKSFFYYPLSSPHPIPCPRLAFKKQILNDSIAAVFRREAEGRRELIGSPPLGARLMWTQRRGPFSRRA
jgi:hypothetical protein